MEEVIKPNFIKIGGPTTAFEPVIDVSSTSFIPSCESFKMYGQKDRGKWTDTDPMPQVMVENIFRIILPLIWYIPATSTGNHASGRRKPVYKE